MKNQFQIIKRYIEKSKRPVVLVGSGINISKSNKELINFIKKYKIPVVSSWAIDAYPNDDRYYYGRQGSIGNRVGNYIVQYCDTLFIFGSRMSIRQTSYNWIDFAKNAKKISIDIDIFEQKKNLIKYDEIITCDLKDLFKFMRKKNFRVLDKNKELKWKKWLEWCDYVKKTLSPKIQDYKIYGDKINIYHFIIFLFKILKNKEIIVAGDGAATVVPQQVGYLNKGIRYIANSGSASMGYDLPAAIGAATAKPDKRIICLAGDGSVMMNIQELQTIKSLNLNILIFIINNDGYLSIKQTQKNFFKKEYGSSSKSGLTFPNFVKIAKSFGIKSLNLKFKNWEKKLKEILVNECGPMLINVDVDLIQQFEPKLKSKQIGEKIFTPSLENMYPFLDKEIQKRILNKLDE